MFSLSWLQTDSKTQFLFNFGVREEETFFGVMFPESVEWSHPLLIPQI